ncbi:MAG: hypothetical protein PHS80_09295 [Methanothrix sp.]|nr:hypothetical protein [Methanothrix sp.]
MVGRTLWIFTKTELRNEKIKALVICCRPSSEIEDVIRGDGWIADALDMLAEGLTLRFTTFTTKCTKHP